jgi:hypothetical protein
MYLAEALTNMKSYALARTELESAVGCGEKIGARGLLAQSNYLLARELEVSGNAADAQAHYKQARAIGAEIQKEPHSDTISKRSDLSPIYAHPAA